MAGRIRVVSPRFIADAHRAGLGVQVWTVNDEPEARRLLEWGVDALITDRPDTMIPLVRAFSGRARSSPSR
jgi:glycerophosphoryl diester phosphodiesterase